MLLSEGFILWSYKKTLLFTSLQQVLCSLTVFLHLFLKKNHGKLEWRASVTCQWLEAYFKRDRVNLYLLYEILTWPPNPTYRMGHFQIRQKSWAWCHCKYLPCVDNWSVTSEAELENQNHWSYSRRNWPCSTETVQLHKECYIPSTHLVIQIWGSS